MKTLAIHLGVMLVAGLALFLGRSQDRSTEPQHPLPSDPSLAQEAPEAGSPTEASQSLPSRWNGEGPASEAPQPTRAVTLLSWRRMYSTVDQKLALTAAQKAPVQEILEEREKEIRSWHESIRKSGILDIRHYEWQIGLMKEAWYRKLDALLDARQHEQLVDLINKGLLNDGLAFTVEPGMTVLD